jgi:hypothetical protein
MTSHRLTLQRSTVIPPDIEVGVVMRKTAPATISFLSEALPGEALPKGWDIWYEVWNNALLPFHAYDAVVLPDTFTGIPASGPRYGFDDAVDYEGDIPVIEGNGPIASAWWEFRPTADCTVTLDTELSTGGLLDADGGATLYPTDTSLMVLTTDEDPPPSGPYPSAATDFTTMVKIAGNDDFADPPPPYWAKVVDVALVAGKVYWFRADTWGSEVDGDLYKDGITYRLRMTVTIP